MLSVADLTHKMFWFYGHFIGLAFVHMICNNLVNYFSTPTEFGSFSLFISRFIFAIFTQNAHLYKTLFYLIVYMWFQDEKQI